MELRVCATCMRVYVCACVRESVCMRVRVRVRNACACAHPCKNVKNPQKNAKKYTPPCEKKIVFCLRRDA